jgi:hypothetical protein
MSTKSRPFCSKPGEDRRGSNDARVAIGQTPAGRYLRIVYVRDPEPLARLDGNAVEPGAWLPAVESTHFQELALARRRVSRGSPRFRARS